MITFFCLTFAKYDLPCENWMRPLYPLQVWSASVVSLETGGLVRCSGGFGVSYHSETLLIKD
jgi:hypothetical protein